MKNNLRKNINAEVFDYIQNHNLFEKYFANYTEFGSNNFSLAQDSAHMGHSSLKKHSFSSVDSDRNRKLSFGTNFDRNLTRSFDKIEEREQQEVKNVVPANPQEPIIMDN
jgi:hypothetical protein